MSANPPAPIEHFCDAEGCDAWGSYGFKWGGRWKWACLAHRERGQRWLAKMKSAGAATPAAAPPAGGQGVLL